MLYTLLTPAASDGASESSTVIDSSNPMDNSSVLSSDSTTSDETSSSSTSTSSDNTTPVGCFSTTEQTIKTLVGWGLIIGMIAVYVYFNKRSMKKRQEYIDRRNNIKPGNKVMTIGGITGTVVEVNPDDNTFVLETGSDELGKSYLRFDKAAIHDTDVPMDVAVEGVETLVEPPVEEPVEETDELFDEANKPKSEEIVEETETTTTETEETEEEKTDEE